MTLTLKQMDELKVAASPLIKWLRDNADPHCKAIIEQYRIDLLEGLAGIPSERKSDIPLNAEMAREYERHPLQ